jgi:naphthoate synthase
VHGDVSSEPPEWRAVTNESGKPFINVIYEKAVGEGIAKA